MINKELLIKMSYNENVDCNLKSDLLNNLKNDFEEYIKLLFDPFLDNYKIYRKILLNKTNFSKMLFDAETMMALERYFNYSFRDLVGIVHYFIQLYNLNYNLLEVRNRLKNVYRFSGYKEFLKENITIQPSKYEAFDELMRNNNIHTDDRFLVGFNAPDHDILKLQEVYAEYLIYKQRFREAEGRVLTYELLEQLHLNNPFLYNNRWVAKYDGDGYGGDLLFALPNNIEELHEVKKQLLKRDGTSDYGINITDNERKVIDEVMGYNNTDYYIDIVRMQFETDGVYNYNVVRFKLNKETGEFISSRNKDEITLLTPTDRGYTLTYKYSQNRIWTI